MSEYAEQVLELDGQEYLRVPVHARIRATTIEEVPGDVRDAVKAEASKKKLYWQDKENPDLVWCQFILDSEGANKNADYMPRTVMLRSYHTAKHKPLDMEHIVIEDLSLVNSSRKNPPVKNTIYGVMANSALADHTGKLLTQKEIDNIELDDEPYRGLDERLTIVAWAAMYYFLFPKTVLEMTKAIQAGTMKVSMERWLRTFDFMVPKADKSDDYEIVTKAQAEKNGIYDKWKVHQYVNGGEILRRTLDYCYGGVASTANPANSLSQFLHQSDKVKVKAAASLADDPVVKNLWARHNEVASAFAVSTSESERAKLALEHTRLHRAIAAYVG